MTSYEKRIMITVVAVAVAVAGNALVLAGIPAGWVDRFREVPSIFPPSRLRVLSLGIHPYLTAAGFWLLLSGVIHRLERQREGTAQERAAFDRVIVWLALIIGSMWALAYGVYIKALMAAYGFVDSGPPILLVVPTVLAGLALLIWMAMLITRAGIGNGVAWIAFATSYLAVLPESVPRELARLRDSIGYDKLPIAGSVLAGLVLLCVYYLRSSQELALAPVEGRVPPRLRPAPPLPLRFNLTGAVPVFVAITLLSIPKTLSGMFPNLPRWFVPTQTVYWILFAMLTVLSSYVVAGIGFDTRRVGPMLERFGYRIEAAQGQPTEEYLDRLIERRIIPSALVLIGIVVLPGLALQAMTGISLSNAGISGVFVLVACAIVLDTLRHARGVRASNGQASSGEDTAEDSGEEHSPGEESLEEASDPPVEDDSATEPSPENWVEVFESDVEFEARLALMALEERGIPGVALSNRVIPLTGTFAFWEWTVPTYPFLVIHRRLGGGKVILRVPARQLDGTREVLAEITRGRPNDGAGVPLLAEPQNQAAER